MATDLRDGRKSRGIDLTLHLKSDLSAIDRSLLFLDALDAAIVTAKFVEAGGA
jgi:hypothetical protein